MSAPRNTDDRGTIVWKQWRGRAPIPSWALLVGGTATWILGLPMLAVGVGALPFGFDAPRPVTIGLGFYFLGFGGVLVLLGLEPHLRGARLVEGSPYRSDYPWSSDGIGEEVRTRVEKPLLGVLTLSGFLPPAHYVAWILLPKGDLLGRVMVFGFLGLFDLVLLTYLLQLTTFSLRRLRFGKTRVVFDDFPFFLGGRLSVTFCGDRQLARRHISVILRCLEEDVRSPSKYRSDTMIVSYERHHAEITARTDGHGRAPISFSLPSEAPGTRLNADLPTYWELIVKTRPPGPAYEGIFLMPVYPD